MNAIVHHAYGSPDLLKLEQVPKPTPADDQVLVKVRAVSVNLSDWEGLTGKPLYARFRGLFKPGDQILGSDIAGRVEAVGGNVKQFRAGDEVYGLLWGYSGGFAEYACASEKALARKPTDMTFDQVATIPQAAVIAVQALRDKGQVQPGHQVLINGAGGGAGSFAVQLAKLYGAEVTGVDNASKLDFIRLLGADHVIDYAREDFTKNGKQYDMILDVIAYRSVFAYQRALKPGGSYFMVGGSAATIFQILLLGPWIQKTTGKKIRLLVVQPNSADMVYVTDLCQAGQVNIEIDRRYPLNEVPDALRYLGEGHARGKIVITIDA